MAFFSTTTRTPRIARPARRTPCDRCPTRACRHRCVGMKSPTCEPGGLHRVHRAAALRGDRRSACRDGRRARLTRSLLELAARDEAAGLGDAPWPPHFRKAKDEGARVAPSRAEAKEAARRLASRRKDLGDLLRGNDFELIERAIARSLVRPPAAKLRRVPKARALHVIVRDLHDELGPQRLPRHDPFPGSIGSRRPACDAARLAARFRLRPAFHGCPSSAFSRYGSRNDTSSRRLASVKLEHTPTCSSFPSSS